MILDNFIGTGVTAIDVLILFKSPASFHGLQDFFVIKHKQSNRILKNLL